MISDRIKNWHLVFILLLLPQQSFAQHYDIDLTIDHISKKLRGKTSISLPPMGETSSLSFNFLDGTVHSVKVNDELVQFDLHDPDQTTPETLALLKAANFKILTIQLPQRSLNSPATLTVEYEDNSFYGTAENPDGDGPPGENPFSLGQILGGNAFSSHLNYFPFLPHFGESANLTITTNLQKAMVVAPGELVHSSNNGEWSTFSFKNNFGPGLIPYPFAIDNYEKLETLALDGKTKISIYYLAEDRKYAEEKMPVVEDIFTFYSELLGSYPFGSLKIVETDLFEGNIGLAGQSLIMLSKRVWFAADLNTHDTSYNNLPLLVLADEINHQWNAYKVQSPNYLAEGISKFFDALYVEKLSGKKAYQEKIRVIEQGVRWFLNEYPELDLPITDPRAHPAIYFNKNALALATLRKELGDQSFMEGWRLYFKDFAGDVTTLDDLRKSFEKSSGRDLNDFFRRWYDEPGLPLDETSRNMTP